MMRIITGSAKGISLKTLAGNLTRPTAERTKEAVFSMLQNDIEGRDVLDMFSGSGQLALEALSRGARSAVMLDNSREAVKIITENARKTGLASRCEIYFENYSTYIKKDAGRKFDIVFLDPPYDSGFYTTALRGLYEKNMLKRTSLIVCESGSSDIFKDDTELAERFLTVKQNKYGRAFITLLMPNGETE